jgi:hypothetical protein
MMSINDEMMIPSGGIVEQKAPLFAKKLQTPKSMYFLATKFTPIKFLDFLDFLDFCL